MQFNLRFMREFFKFFHRSEMDGITSSSDVMNTKEVGEINIITPKGKETISLAITDEKRNTQNTAWMIKTIDGRFIVIFHIDYFIKQLFSHNMDALYATVAHEIGHYLCGHFENAPSASLDVKREVQDFFHKQYEHSPTPANEVAYMRSVFFALLKGGVVIRELEADMMALKFVPVANLVHIHTQDFDDKVNVFTVVEKVNRIKRLNHYAENNDIDKEGYNLFVQLYDTKEDT